MNAAGAPLSVALARDALTLQWPDGASTIPAATLRAQCRCAGCQSSRLRGQTLDSAGAALVDAVPVGHYALQLRFADGHERGIYPWQALRALGAAA